MSVTRITRYDRTSPPSTLLGTLAVPIEQHVTEVRSQLNFGIWPEIKPRKRDAELPNPVIRDVAYEMRTDVSEGMRPPVWNDVRSMRGPIGNSHEVLVRQGESLTRCSGCLRG
jgi:hypothetical protein